MLAWPCFWANTVGMDLNIDAYEFMASFLVSSIGFVLMAYGKKMSRVPHLVVGVLLMVYPYFVPGALLILLTGGLILGLLWLGVRRGM